MNGLLESRMRRKFASPVRRRAVGKGLSDTRQNLAGRPTYPEEDRDETATHDGGAAIRHESDETHDSAIAKSIALDLRGSPGCVAMANLERRIRMLRKPESLLGADA